MIREHPVAFARVVARRMGQMLTYSGGEPALVREAQPALVLPSNQLPEPADPGRHYDESGPETTEPGDARIHDLTRVKRDEKFLAPGRWAHPLRGVVRKVQSVLVATLTPLVAAGTLGLLAFSWRRAMLLLALPLYVLASYSPFLYEWRVAVPMHYPLFAAAGAALLVAWAGLGAMGRRVAWRRPAAGAQNQAG